jgi:hypothetical protein
MIAVVRRRFAFANLMNEHYAEFVAGRKASLAKKKVYVHPTDHSERRVVFYYTHTLGGINDMIGPEQVSAHYESYWISRRYSLTGLFLFTSCALLQRVTDLNWVLRSYAASISLYFTLMILFYEVPKYMFLPMLTTFYNFTMVNELKMMQNAIPERVQALVDKNMKEALGQFDFLILHRKFAAVKAESLRNFLVNQELELKQGIKERAADLLKMAEDFEASNQKQLVGKVVAALREDIDKLLQAPPKEVVDAAFDSALVGVKEGRMTYQGDRALDFILQRIRTEAEKFKGLSDEQLPNQTTPADRTDPGTDQGSP